MTTLTLGMAAAQPSPASAQQAPAVPAQQTPAVPAQKAPAVPTQQAADDGAPKTVEPPRLLRFVEADYPPAAAAQKLQGEVVLRLDIDAQGRVTAAEVVEGAGHGFDEAARAAAMRFEFEPARRGDRAVAVRILYRYSFVLKEEPAQRAPSGALRGRVLANPGAVPVASARVQVELPNNRTIERTTDERGAWSIEELPPGAYRVRVLAPGFETAEAQEEVVDQQATEVVYRIRAPAVADESGAITVDVQEDRPSREVTRRTLSRREMARIPGTFGDALRSVQNMPGVARPPSLSGLLIVRGTDAESTQVFIDGMYVLNVYHFGGLSSVVPTEMLERIDFQPGNYSLQYGRGVGGIVDVTLRPANPDGQYHGMVQLDFVDARAMAEGPIPFLDGWKFLAGVRRSHLDTWLTPILESSDSDIQATPVYYDYQLFAETRPTRDSYLRIGMLGSDDRLSLVSEGGLESGKLRQGEAFWYVSSLYRNRINADLNWWHTVAFGRLRQKVEVASVFADTNVSTFLVRGELSWKLAPKATLSVGPDVLFAPFDTEGVIPDEPGPGNPEGGSFVVRPPTTVDTRDVFFRPAAYGEFVLTPTRALRLVSGARVDYSRDTERVDVSPRMNGRLDVTKGFPRTTLKGGVGLFHEPPQVRYSLEGYGNGGLRSARALQTSAGVEQEFTSQVEASVEGFYTALDDLFSREPGADGRLEFGNNAGGRAFGAELMLRYKADEHFFGWLSYTLSRSVRRVGTDEPETVFGADQTHILTMLGSVQLGRGWELGGRFRFVSGNPYTPCINALYSSTSSAYNCVPGELGSERMPAFHQLDIRVDKAWQLKDFRISTYLDLVNAYNRVNPDIVAYNYDYTRQRYYSASLPIIPSFGVRGEF